MNFNEFKKLVAAQAEALGVTEYEMYYQGEEAVSVTVYRHEVDAFTAANEGGVCFRCIVDGKMGYASTESLTPEQAALTVRRAVDNAAALETDEPVFLAVGGQTYQPLEEKSYDLPGTEALLELALTAQEQLYQADGHIIDGSMTRAIAQRSAIAITNSRGLDVSRERAMLALMSDAVVEKDGEKADDYCLVTGPEALDTQRTARTAASRALAAIGAAPAHTGSYPVVFAPKAVAGLLSVFSSCFSSEAAQKGLSRLAGREGALIAGEKVTLVDDPFCAMSPMPMPFDGEGTPTARKNVIEKGRLNTLLYNLKTAAVAGKQTTGNAAKASYDAPVTVQPFTMYFAPGDYTRQQLLELAGQGVYIEQLQGLHAGASPVTGDFSLQSAGFMIREGKLAEPVKSFTVAGNFYKLLGQITALSDTVELPDAMGKTAFGGPCLLVEGLSVAGK